MSGDLPREPPAAVKRQLRREVGFGCPVPECRSPYLTYHHFDPEWHVEHHHRPEGMIPLCHPHHDKAKAWTPAQLREMKEHATKNADGLVGRFEWMRQHAIALVGGNFWFGSTRIVSIEHEPVIWYERDEDGHLLLNVRQPTTSGEPRSELRNNDWVIAGSPSDLVSPPSGSEIRVTYRNGDDLGVRFWEAQTLDDVLRRYKMKHGQGFIDQQVPFPLLVTEVTLLVAEAGIDFTPTETRVGAGVMTGFGVIRTEHGCVINRA